MKIPNWVLDPFSDTEESGLPLQELKTKFVEKLDDFWLQKHISKLKTVAKNFLFHSLHHIEQEVDSMQLQSVDEKKRILYLVENEEIRTDVDKNWIKYRHITSITSGPNFSIK